MNVAQGYSDCLTLCEDVVSTTIKKERNNNDKNTHTHTHEYVYTWVIIQFQSVFRLDGRNRKAFPLSHYLVLFFSSIAWDPKEIYKETLSTTDSLFQNLWTKNQGQKNQVLTFTATNTHMDICPHLCVCRCMQYRSESKQVCLMKQDYAFLTSLSTAASQLENGETWSFKFYSRPVRTTEACNFRCISLEV